MQRKILISLSILGVILLAAILLLPRLMDLEFYREQITSGVQAATGRTLTIDGGLRAEISLQPSFSLSDIKLSNMDGGSKPDMASIEQLNIKLKLLPLLYGEVHIKRIFATGVTLLLETDAKSRSNWNFTPKEATNKEDKSEPAAIPTIDQLELHNLSLIQHDAKSGQTRKIRLKQLKVRNIDLLTPMQLTLDGELEQQPLHLTASATLSEESDSLQVTQLKATLGESDLSGNLTLKWDKELPYIQADIHSERISLAPEEVAGQPKPEAESKIEPEGQQSKIINTEAPVQTETETDSKPTIKPSGKIFSSEPLSLGTLTKLNGAINYQIKNIGGITPAITDISAKIKLKQGDITAPLRFQLAGSSINTNLNIDLRTTTPKIALHVTAKSLNLGKLIQSSSGKSIFSGNCDLKAKLHGRGKSVADIMASLNGESDLLVGPGELKASLDNVTGGLQHILGALIMPDSSSSQVNCLASKMKFKSGIATSHAFLLDSKHSTLLGAGNINLKSEQLELLFTPKPKSATLNVAVPIVVGGTLAQPSFSLKKSSSLRKIVGLAGLFVFPPAALIGLAELGTGEDNPCLQMAKGGEIPDAAKESSEEKTGQQEQESNKPVIEGLPGQ